MLSLFNVLLPYTSDCITTNHRKGVRQHKLNKKILQGSKDHKHHGELKFQFSHDSDGLDHYKQEIG